MTIVYFAVIRPAREDAACRAYIRREWYRKLCTPGPTFAEGDRVRAVDWEMLDECGTVVGVVVERTADGVERPAYWVTFDTMLREIGPDARPLLMAPCELECEC